MAVTLNQIVSRIEGIASKHQQIKTVFFGNLFEFLAKTPDSRYPAMYFDLVNASINGSITTVTFSFFFMDRMLPELTNETEVLSDQLLVAQDILSQLRYSKYPEFITGDNIPIEFFTEESPDLIAGVKADIDFEIDFALDRCAVPTTYTYPS